MTSGRRSRTAQRVVLPSDDAAPAALYLRPLHGAITWDRYAIRLPAHSAVSLRTYFAAFPAALWMRKTGARRVTIRADFTGEASVRISVRSASAVREQTSQAAPGRFLQDVELAPGDQWVWLEVESGAGDVEVRDIAWELGSADMGSTAVCITTHDRPSDCVRLLEAIAGDDALSCVDHIIVVDQGTRRVREEQGYADVAEVLGRRLRLIEQANLGGSGGFSRGMLEAVDAGADNAVLLDDDVRLEPESVRRMIALAARSDRDAIIGAHMLDLLRPTRLHSWGERVESGRFEWAPIAAELRDLDLDDCDVTTLPADAAVEFNGWWMCLLPGSVVRKLGAAMPYFIKWDDTEYSLRAAAASVETVTMPGAALWHLPWTGKDDGLDWQAYFQLRNRVVTALFHARTRRGARLLGATFALDVNHVLCMQYGSAAARRLALEDVLRGPGNLDDTLATRVAAVRELMSRAGQVVVAERDLPSPREASAPPRPASAVSTLARLARVIAHQLRASRPQDPSGVDRSVTRAEGKWWSLGILDSAIMESATGRGHFVLRRDRRRAVALLRDAVVLRVRLWTAWPSLARSYRAAAGDIASLATWAARFRVGPVEPRSVESLGTENASTDG